MSPCTKHGVSLDLITRSVYCKTVCITVNFKKIHPSIKKYGSGEIQTADLLDNNNATPLDFINISLQIA